MEVPWRLYMYFRVYCSGASPLLNVAKDKKFIRPRVDQKGHYILERQDSVVWTLFNSSSCMLSIGNG